MHVVPALCERTRKPGGIENRQDSAKDSLRCARTSRSSPIQARRSASRFTRFSLRIRQILVELSAKVESLSHCGVAAFFWQGVDQVADAVCYLAYARVAGSEQHSDHLRAAAATEELLAESIRCAGHSSCGGCGLCAVWVVLLLAVLSASRCCVLRYTAQSPSQHM